MIGLNITIQQEASGAVRVSITDHVTGGTPNEKDTLAVLTAETSHPQNRIHTALIDLCARLGVKAD